MTRYVVMTVSIDGNYAEICESFATVKETVRRMLDTPDSTGGRLDDEDRKYMEADLALMTEDYLPHIRGQSAWKESAYIAPLTEREPSESSWKVYYEHMNAQMGDIMEALERSSSKLPPITPWEHIKFFVSRWL